MNFIKVHMKVHMCLSPHVNHGGARGMSAVRPMSEQHGQHHETFRCATSLRSTRDHSTPIGQAPLPLLQTLLTLRRLVN